MDGALARFFYQEPDREARVRMVSSSLAFRLATSTGLAVLLALLSGPLAGLLMSGEAYRKYLLLGAVTLPFTLLVMFGNDVLRVTFQPWKYIALNLTQTVLVAGFSLYFVLVREAGVVGVLYGRLLGDMISTVLALVLLRHSLAPAFSRASLARMLSYGIPAVPAAFGFAVIAGLDRFVLQRTQSLEEVAIYAVALKCFAVVSLAASAFQLAYGPFAFARAETPEAPRLYARVFLGYLAVATLGALVVAAFAPEALAFLVPSRYAAAALPAVWLCFAAVAFGAYTVASLGIGLALRTPLLAWCAGIGAIVALVAQFAFTPRFGAPGAAFATFAAYAATAIVTYGVAQRVHPLPLRGGRAVVLVSVGLGLAFVAQRLAPPGILGTAMKLAIAVAFAAGCIVFKVHRDAGAIAPGVAAPAPVPGTGPRPS